MAKVTVWLIRAPKLVGKIKLVENGETRIIDLRHLSKRQKKYFRKAYSAFLRNISCWDFNESYIADHHFVSSEYSRLIDALTELWLALGVNQGQMSSDHDIAVYIWI